MEKRRLKLPIGIQTFETIRSEGYVYVDKTQYIVNLIDTGKIYFLARPRRFGKSLTVSTLESLFSGRKELFKGLYAEDFLNRPDFNPSPVICLDLSKPATDCGMDVFRQTVVKQMKDLASQLDVTLSDGISPGSVLDELIVRTARRYQQKVVVLLDEYDAPYNEFVNDPDTANTIRDILRNFYVQLKANDKYIRFTFITGISKYARFGVFSTLNTPVDISLMPQYAEICGYTEEEILHYFPDYIEDTANHLQISPEELIDQMRYYYNGFSFDSGAKARLYNPFSTLLFFAQQEFYNYWIDSGRPKFIADYLKHRNLTVEQFRNYPISRDFAKSPGDGDTTSPEGFLYQCGYLTLRPGISDDLSLDYPNTEVLNSMSKLLSENILTDNTYHSFRNELLRGLMSADGDQVVAVLNRLLASIPYDDFSAAARSSIAENNYGIKPQEWLYRSTILAFLRGCGVVVIAEMHTNLGRADLVVSHKGKTWVIELKVAYDGESPDEKAKEALKQIIDKNYAKPYPGAVCLALAIDDSLRQIANHEVHSSA